MEQEKIAANSVRETYESLNEYGAVAGSRGSRQRVAGDGRASSFNARTDFKTALQMAQTGWDAEAAEALNLAEQSLAKLREDRLIPWLTATWDLSGAEVDVPTYLNNVPECMLEFPPVPQLRQGDTVTIVRGFTVSGFTDADDIIKYGRLIAALVLAIEAMGLSAEVWADGIVNTSTYGGRGHLYQRVKVKGAADMLHAGQLMFALAHPAMLRQIGFGSFDDREGFPEGLYESLSPGHGRGSSGSRNEKEMALYPEGTLFFDASEWDQDPVIFLVEQLRKLNLIPEMV
jgi:hypothetical protein